MSTPTIRKRVNTDKYTYDTTGLPMLLDEHTASKLLGVSLSYLRKARSEGTTRGRTPAPQHVRVGGRCLYPLAVCVAWVDGLMGAVS